MPGLGYSPQIEGMGWGKRLLIRSVEAQSQWKRTIYPCPASLIKIALGG